MDTQSLMKQAGFRENTSIDKAKGLILQGKWHPTTRETKQATQQLLQIFTQDEHAQIQNQSHEQHTQSQMRRRDLDLEAQYLEQHDFLKSMKVQRWGTLCGFLSRNSLSQEEVHILKSEKNMLEDELLEEYALDVRSWGSPLTYDIQQF